MLLQIKGRLRHKEGDDFYSSTRKLKAKTVASQYYQDIRNVIY